MVKEKDDWQTLLRKVGPSCLLSSWKSFNFVDSWEKLCIQVIILTRIFSSLSFQRSPCLWKIKIAQLRHIYTWKHSLTKKWDRGYLKFERQKEGDDRREWGILFWPTAPLIRKFSLEPPLLLWEGLGSGRGVGIVIFPIKLSSFNVPLDFFHSVIYVGVGERSIPGLFLKTYDTRWQSLLMASINIYPPNILRHIKS